MGEKVQQTDQKQFMVEKRNGRLEPFDVDKMSRAVSRAGTPFVMARDISISIKKDLFHVSSENDYDNNGINSNHNDKIIVNSNRLRELVAAELVNRNQSTIAESYSGYNKNSMTAIREELSRNDKFDSKVSSSMNTDAKQSAKDKDNTSGRGSKIGSH